MQPRLIRLRDAPTYLGMDKNRFNGEVRPKLIEIPIGNHGIAFDRLDLDIWVKHYKMCSGRPGKRKSLWDANTYQNSSNEVMFSTSTKKLTGDVFAKALAQATSKKRKNA